MEVEVPIAPRTEQSAPSAPTMPVCIGKRQARAALSSRAVIAVILGLLAYPTLPSLPAAAAHHHTAQEAQKRLKDLERQKKEFRERAEKVRKKEQLAMAQLNKIKTKLKATTRELKHNKSILAKTETHLRNCETNLTKTADQEQTLSEGATQRLREMYEGQRLGLLEALFQVTSLQQLMDVLYFQERIAEQDKGLIDELRARERALAAQRSKLGNEKVKLGDIVIEFAKKALALNKEKTDQEQVAEKLRTQRTFYEAAEQQLNRESNQLEHQILEMMKANKSTDKVVTHGSGNLCMPLKAPVTSPFGWRRHPIFGVRKFHTGVDLAGPNHSPIKAADSGNVLYSGWYGGYGKVIIVGHGNGLATLYAHLSKAAASPGQNVKKGDVIGYEGSTGFSTGPHLHFEVRVNGKPNNPLNFVR